MANDVEVFAGDSLDIYCTVKDPDDVAVNLLDAAAVYSVSKSVKDTAAPLIVKTSSVPGEIDLTVAGEMTIHLLSTDTEGKTPGSYYHEAQVTLDDGRVGTTLTGKFKIKENLIAPR
jgi:hypothetical protein